MATYNALTSRTDAAALIPEERSKEIIQDEVTLELFKIKMAETLIQSFSHFLEKSDLF